MAARAPSLLPMIGVLWCSAGCGTEPRCDQPFEPLRREATFAVVLSDYASSAVAILDARGDVLEPAWFTSGSRAPLLVTPISGDVVLPQTPLGTGRLGWIDRYAIDVLTVVGMPGGAVQSQHDLRGDRDGARTGFSPNPQDALTLPDGRILVSRLNPNPNGAAPAIALGNDLLALDLASGALTHVALGCDAAGDDGTTYFARPSDVALLTAGDRRIVVAGLARLDAAFVGSGPGAVALVDAVTLAPLGCLELDPLANCTGVAVEPDAPDRAIVLCSGPTFAGAAERRARAGIVELELTTDGGLTVLARVLPSAGAATPSGGLVATGGGHAVVVSDPRGDDPPPPDRLWDVDLALGTSTLVMEGEPFSLGLGTTDGGVLLVPDAARRTILRFDLTNGVPSLHDEVVIGGCADLPPRQVAPLGP